MTRSSTQKPSIWWNIGECVGVEVVAVDAAGRDEAERRRAPAHRADLHGRGVRAQHAGRPRRRTCPACRAPGWSSGMLSASKLFHSVSTSGPSSTEKPSAGEEARPSRARSAVTGCSAAARRRGAGQRHVESSARERRRLRSAALELGVARVGPAPRCAPSRWFAAAPSARALLGRAARRAAQHARDASPSCRGSARAARAAPAASGRLRQHALRLAQDRLELAAAVIGPRHAQSGVRRLGERPRALRERLRIGDREIGEVLAVELDARLREPVDQLAVGEPVRRAPPR